MIRRIRRLVARLVAEPEQVTPPDDLRSYQIPPDRVLPATIVVSDAITGQVMFRRDVVIDRASKTVTINLPVTMRWEGDPAVLERYGPAPS